MKNMPTPATKAELVSLLEDILESVKASDSFEGSLEYLMPMPPENHEPVHDGSFVCKVCGMGVDLEWALENGRDPEEALIASHAGDPATTPAGEPTAFMVRGAYRVGNSRGQGGVVMVGDMR